MKTIQLNIFMLSILTLAYCYCESCNSQYFDKLCNSDGLQSITNNEQDSTVPHTTHNLYNFTVKKLNRMLSSINNKTHANDDGALVLKIKTFQPFQQIFIGNLTSDFYVSCSNNSIYRSTVQYHGAICSYSIPGLHYIRIKSKHDNNTGYFRVSDNQEQTSLVSLMPTDHLSDRSIVQVFFTRGGINQNNYINDFASRKPLKATYVTLKDDVIVDLFVANILPHTANYEVDCDSDGIYEHKYYGIAASCFFAKSGRHQISIRGIIPHIKFTDDDDIFILESIDQWGDNVWYNVSKMFSNRDHFNIKAKDAPDLTHVQDMSEMFAFTNAMNANINHWDVSNVRNMNRMFYLASSFNQPLDKWDTSNVTDMTSMFGYARKFNKNINSWNVSNVKYMSGMFYKAESFNQPLDKWNVSKVEFMADMFAYSKFSQPLNSWNIDSLKDARGMFEFSSCEKYTDCKPRIYFRDKKFIDKVHARMQSLGRKVDLRYNPKADPWKAYPGDPAYDSDDDVYDRP